MSMFAAFPSATEPPSLGMIAAQSTPNKVEIFPMEDVYGVLGGLQVIEYDALFCDVPAKLDLYLEQVLRSALSAGAVIAWCAFEGSFHFDHLLTPGIAPQVYAVADAAGAELAADEDLESQEWRRRLGEARRRLLAERGS